MKQQLEHSKLSTPTELFALRDKILARKKKGALRITICAGTGCVAFGSYSVQDALREEISKRNLEDKIELKVTGCHGFCEKGPVTVILPDETLYVSLKPSDAPEIIDGIEQGTIVDRLLYVNPVTGEKIVKNPEVPFYAGQERLVFRHNGLIDPTSIEDYISTDGYQALAKAVTEMSPVQVLDEVTAAGLRGRGGAGFPTGRKWEFCRDAKGSPKYIICNADEGDPGAFMDRSVLEGDPHAVVEGMIIGAYAVGAAKGYVYVRAEYPLAVKHLRIALDSARALGLLGENILGSGFSFDIIVKEGAGAFVCGEETALIASIEGRRGMPRPRPPFPAVSGLWGKPTNINNVETWANVPVILLKGADWYSSIGTETSKGTKIFALAGKVNNTGLVEVPMGTTIRQIVFDIGGGVPEGAEFKAVQIGGPSGGCLPAEYLDLPVDYESVTKAGAIMGSGGLIVLDSSTCMVDIARYFLDFTQNESCGKCPPCRVGTKRMLEILENITQGKGRIEDLDLLEELAIKIKDSALCGLGQTAPNPVLTTLRYFRDEYEAHVIEKRCPAGACKALISYVIDKESCTGCGKCKKVCPRDAISGEKKKPHVIDKEKCIRCGICLDNCKFGAIKIS